MDPVARVVVEIAGILLLGALGEFIFARTRVPDVVWLVVAGILAGPISGLIPSGLLRPGIPFFGAIALTVILSSGAFRLQLTEVAAAALERARGFSLAGVAAVELHDAIFQAEAAIA